MHTSREIERKKKVEVMPRAQPNVVQSHHTPFSLTLKPVGSLSSHYLTDYTHTYTLPPILSSHFSLHGLLPVTVISMGATSGLLLSSFRLSRISPLV